jgi:hypothetical protein
VRLFDLGNKKTRQGSAGCDRLQREVIAPDQLICGGRSKSGVKVTA